MTDFQRPVGFLPGYALDFDRTWWPSRRAYYTKIDRRTLLGKFLFLKIFEEGMPKFLELIYPRQSTERIRFVGTRVSEPIRGTCVARTSPPRALRLPCLSTPRRTLFTNRGLEVGRVGAGQRGRGPRVLAAAAIGYRLLARYGGRAPRSSGATRRRRSARRAWNATPRESSTTSTDARRRRRRRRQRRL